MGIDDFNFYADNYRQILDDNIRISGGNSEYFSEYKIIELYNYYIDNNQPINGLKILDLGCGDGNSAKFFLKYFPDCEYIGIDISDKSIDVAKRNYANVKNIKFCLYDGVSIPYEDNSFDVVFISCVIHHVPPRNHKPLLKECRRVLIESGNLFVFEHNPYNPLTVKVVNECQFDVNAILMSAKYLKAVIKAAGYNSISSRYTIFIPRFGVLKKILFIEKYLYRIPLGGQYYVIAKKTDLSK